MFFKTLKMLKYNQKKCPAKNNFTLTDKNNTIYFN